MPPQYRIIVCSIGAPSFGPDISVASEFIDTTTSPESSAGIVQIPVPCATATDTPSIRSAFPAALATWCSNNGVVTPTNVFWTMDGAMISQSQVTGLTTSLSTKANTSSLATVATTGDYNDLINKPAAGGTRTTSSQTLSLVGTGATGTQISSTKDSTVRFTVSTSATATIAGSATSTVTLKKCATNSATESDWTSAGVLETSQAYSLAVALQGVTGSKGQLITDLPTGWYVKLVNTGAGTHSESFVSGEKTIYG